MHLSFESLVVIDTLSLYVSLMDFHHDTSFRSILEDDSISLTFKIHIHSCLGKGVGLWLVVGHLFICFASHILLSFQCCVFVFV
jgi:hypothetical protein